MAGRTRPHRRQLPDVGEADRALREALLEAADDLADLDVARWRPEVADELMNLRHRPDARRAARHARRGASTSPPAGCRRWAIVDLALDDDGGALSAYEVGAAARRCCAARPRGPARAGRGVLARGVAGPLSRAAQAVAQTPSTLPLGSVKSNRRPPGNS